MAHLKKWGYWRTVYFLQQKQNDKTDSCLTDTKLSTSCAQCLFNSQFWGATSTSFTFSFPDVRLLDLRRHRLVQDWHRVLGVLPPAQVSHAGKVSRPRGWSLPPPAQGMPIRSHVGEQIYWHFYHLSVHQYFHVFAADLVSLKLVILCGGVLLHIW